MTDLAKLVVALEAQTAKYQDGLDAADRRLEKFTRNQNRVLADVQKKFSNFGSTIQGALAGIGVGLSFRGIIQATAEAEAAQAQLNNALENTGANVAEASREFQAWATQLQRTTTFNDEAIMQVEALLLSFRGLSGQTVKDATAAVLDLSTRMGIDAPAAAKLLGKALADPEKGMVALTRAGVVFSEGQKAQIKALAEAGKASEAQAMILAQLESRFGGAAEAARNTFGGALAGLKNSFGDLLEGKSGMGAATDAVNNLTETLNSEEVKRGFETIVSGFAKVIEFAAKAASAVAGFAKNFGEGLAKMTGAAVPIEALDLDEVVRMLDEVEERRRNFTTMIPNAEQNSAVQFQLKILDDQIARLKERQALLNALPAPVQEQADPKALKFNTSGVGTEEPDTGPSKKENDDAVKRATEQYEGLQAVEALITDLHNQELARRAEYDYAYYESVADLDAQLKEQLAQGDSDLLDKMAEESKRKIEIAAQTNAKLAELDERRLQGATNLLGILFGKHKAVAAAIFLIQKRHAIAEAVIDTKAAVMKTYAKLGYPWGIPAAIAVGAIGAASIAEMVASNPGTAGLITGQGGNGFLPPGSEDNPVHTTEQEGRRGVDDKPVTQIIFKGDVYGFDDFQDKVFDALDTGINVRDRVPIRTTSRQAQELKG